MILYVLRLILCNTKTSEWLKAQAKKTDTPIDDYAIGLIEYLLCPDETKLQ